MRLFKSNIPLKSKLGTKELLIKKLKLCVQHYNSLAVRSDPAQVINEASTEGVDMVIDDDYDTEDCDD